jgi:DNA-binding response OmpR family regulator
LLVDDNDALRSIVRDALENYGFEVVDSSNVKEALRLIATDTFSVLLSDLQMPDPGDGFTLVSAMRHSNPRTVNLVYSGHPDLKQAMSAILKQADEVLLKPFDLSSLPVLIQSKLEKGASRQARIVERTADILARETPKIIQSWLTRVERTAALNSLALSQEDRTAHLPQLLEELVGRLRQPQIHEGMARESKAAKLHGVLRRNQGYTSPMMVAESRILQVSVFEALHLNLANIDFSHVLSDVMNIADELDAQLEQTVAAWTAASSQPAA